MKSFIKSTSLYRSLGRYPRIVKFAVVGSTNTGVDITLYFIFANLLLIMPVVASIISTGITLCLSFYLNHRFVFKNNKRKRHVIFQFILITLFNVWVVQSAVIALVLHTFEGVALFEAHEWSFNLFCKLCGVAISFILNYLGYGIIFKQKEIERLP
jgi:putative flippase GtrA